MSLKSEEANKRVTILARECPTVKFPSKSKYPVLCVETRGEPSQSSSSLMLLELNSSRTPHLNSYQVVICYITQDSTICTSNCCTDSAA